MSRFFRRPEMAGLLSWARKVVYGPGYRRARRGAFQRSDGWCQFCGLFPAEEAHHWGWRYPADTEITADDLTALCRRCHWVATLVRLTGRALAGVWFILATATPLVRPPQACCPPSAAQLPRPAAADSVARGGPRRGTGSARAGRAVPPGAGRRLPVLSAFRPARHRPIAPARLAVDVGGTAAPPPVLLPVPEPYPVGVAGRLAPGADRRLAGTPCARRRGARGGMRP